MLATLSFADYAAHAERSRLRAVLERRSYQTAIYAGLALFASGLSGTAAAWWEIALWIVLTLAFVVLAWRTWKEAGIRG